MENQRVTDVIIGVGINVRIDDFPKELQQSAGNLSRNNHHLPATNSLLPSGKPS